MAVGRRGQEDNTRIENWLKSFDNHAGETASMGRVDDS
jgi:hypothetical protein